MHSRNPISSSGIALLQGRTQLIRERVPLLADSVTQENGSVRGL